MYVNAASASLSTASAQPSASLIQSTDSAFAALLNNSSESAESMLSDITKDGLNSYMKWQIQQMQKQITDQVMASKNLTADKIAAMPAKQRVALEQQIIQEVAQKLKQAMSQEMKKNAPNQLGFDMMDSSGDAMQMANSVNIVA